MVYRAASGMAATGGDYNPTKLVVVQLFSMFLGLGAFVFLTVIDADLLGDQWKCKAPTTCSFWWPRSI